MAWIQRQRTDGSTEFVARGPASQTDGAVRVVWDDNVEAELGRGSSDPDITYIRLRNTGATFYYLFPNAAGDGVTVQATRP